MKQSDVFNKYLDIAHYHILEGFGEQKKSIQAIKLSRLDKALQIALPDVDINYIAINEGAMSLTAKWYVDLVILEPILPSFVSVSEVLFVQ